MLLASWQSMLVLWQRGTASGETQILSASREILLPRPSRIFIDGEDGVYNLVIQNVMIDDEGQYTCQIPSSSHDNMVTNLTVNGECKVRMFVYILIQKLVEIGE